MQTVIDHWDLMAPVLSPLQSEGDYEAMVERMNALMDYIGDDEGHPLTGLLHLMGDLVSEHDAEHYGPVESATGVEMLRHFMQDRGLKQTDLPEIGSQGVVSEILGGKRELNLRQIQALSTRFGVPASLFV
ncbi:MAG: transcriptional regulator [Gammaproteobacteria bacterium]|nr:transcriptional regulator [Gammaproteobacteria bacterium]MBU1655204.1 transcriptional regulator [Gammaproteobacteria bacterium]MBU1962803.1 transcriptional regulator [Gammaproteobacteria bacterium]